MRLTQVRCGDQSQVPPLPLPPPLAMPLQLPPLLPVPAPVRRGLLLASRLVIHICDKLTDIGTSAMSMESDSLLPKRLAMLTHDVSMGAQNAILSSHLTLPLPHPQPLLPQLDLPLHPLQPPARTSVSVPRLPSALTPSLCLFCWCAKFPCFAVDLCVHSAYYRIAAPCPVRCTCGGSPGSSTSDDACTPLTAAYLSMCCQT